VIFLNIVNVVLKFQSEVWICMELMSTCLDKLLKRTKTPIPERILGKMAVAVSMRSIY
jgi:small neutral amino acid transporter SnatA (MarC family)